MEKNPIQAVSLQYKEISVANDKNYVQIIFEYKEIPTVIGILSTGIVQGIISSFSHNGDGLFKVIAPIQHVFYMDNTKITLNVF